MALVKIQARPLSTSQLLLAALNGVDAALSTRRTTVTVKVQPTTIRVERPTLDLSVGNCSALGKHFERFTSSIGRYQSFSKYWSQLNYSTLSATHAAKMQLADKTIYLVVARARNDQYAVFAFEAQDQYGQPVSVDSLWNSQGQLVWKSDTGLRSSDVGVEVIVLNAYAQQLAGKYDTEIDISNITRL